MSGCNLTRGCAEDDCGMFRITRLYWVDAGQPTLQLDDPKTDGAYQRCTLDPVCAARTVRGYMNKFIDKDCNGDGTVDCMDYAASHFLSGYSCSAPLDNDYAKTMRSCLAQVAGLAINKS
ncbi:invertebrate-type lysozyme 3-like [Homalodisca vitripennis]|nr:invertebrate-type lysozyme 3-like [Homalodisca vitripennis]